jgi:hypothetical protein
MREEMAQEIRRQCAAGELVLVEIKDIPHAQVRPIYMVASLHKRIFSPGAEESRRMGFLEADLRSFINGDKVTIARGKEETCTLKPLSDVDEVWELRSRGPKPSLRIFGRFADKDVLIATNMEYRTLLSSLRSRAFAVAIRTCTTTWSRLFPYLEPHRGTTGHDYVSNVVDLDYDVP